MIKLLITGIWISAVALASVYYSVQMANQREPTEPDPAMFGGLQSIRGEVTSIPVISGGAVKGYFLTRLSYTVDPEKTAKMTIPARDLVTDALYTALVGDKLIDFPNMTQFDLEGFKARILETINTRLGEEVFHDVVVEQIDYLSKEDIRTNMRRNTTNAPAAGAVPGESKPTKKAEAEVSH
ncbi:MAG: hypothetical protein RIA09_01100 [Hoeflea sp.]|jgi:hypothetical protein|uniref:hypothetical protein n=1 Tax=Hoeflea sp. TaxID=1940281 RepID=UPI0032EAB697